MRSIIRAAAVAVPAFVPGGTQDAYAEDHASAPTVTSGPGGITTFDTGWSDPCRQVPVPAGCKQS